MNLVSDRPLRKYQIKQKCRKVERIILSSSLDLDEKERIMTKVFKNYFGNDIDTDEPTCWFNINNHRCNLQLLFSSVFVRFHRKPKSRDSKLPDVIKRMTLANFIFKHANPIGLILLEKIMIEIS